MVKHVYGCTPQIHKRILLCIQGSKKTQGSKLGPADESRASLAHVLFLAHTQDHPSKDLSGQTNQWQKVCSIMGHVTIWILFFDLSWCSWRLKRARALAEPHGHNRRQELLAFKASSLETQRETQREGTTGCYNRETQREERKKRGNDAKWKMSLL